MIAAQERRLLQAYLDAELDAASVLEFEKRLSTSPELASEYQRLAALQQRLRDLATRFRPPDGFAERAFAALPESIPKASLSMVPSWWRTWAIGSSLAAAALALIIAVPVLRSPVQDGQLAEEVAIAHARALMGARLTDVESADRHTVKPWFSSRLDFSPPVPDLSNEGFELLGGRLDYLNGRPVAAVVYQLRRHPINVFVWPTTGASSVVTRSDHQRGYNLTRFQSRGMHYWAISDLNAREFDKFVKLLQAAQP
jgi:anti-sigma factor RsiW